MVDRLNKKLIWLCLWMALLLGAIVTAKVTLFPGEVRFRTEAPGQLSYRFTADTSLYHFTSQEGKMPASANFFSDEFLKHVPIQIGEWVGQDTAHQFADITLFRLYRHKRTGDYLWFILVYGGHPSQFHSAEVCYIGDGWDVAKREIKRVETDEDSFPMRYFIAQKENALHMVGYWYLWPRSERDLSQGTLLFRLSLESPSSEEKGLGAMKDFLQSLMNLRHMGEEKKSAPLVTHPTALTSPPVTVVLENQISGSTKKAIKWILNQRVPNDVVPFPHLKRRYLTLSYELNSNHPITENDKSYRYIYSRSATYDHALAVIALTMAGYFKEAQALVEAFERLLNEDGTLYFAYNTHDDWPSRGYDDGAIIRSGASSWAGYAMLFYIRRRLLDDPTLLKRDPFLKKVLGWVTLIVEALLKEQILIVGDPRYGAITGGNGAYDLVWDEKQKKVVEKFKPGKVSWASIEHNLDFYFLLKDLASLTEVKKYEIARDQVKEALWRAWGDEGQFYRGLREKKIDKALSLDCASWGLLWLKALGDERRVAQAWRALKRYEVVDSLKGVAGYRPYHDTLVFDDPPHFNRLFYPHKPDKKWSDIQMVWSEGSLGVAMAALKMGEMSQAKSILQEMIKMQAPSGGISYSTQEIPFQFSPSPSMAGTAWFVMVAKSLEDPRLLDLFWN